MICVFGSERFGALALETYLVSLNLPPEFVGFHKPTQASLDVLARLQPRWVLTSIRAAIEWRAQLLALRVPILVLEVSSEGTILSHDPLI
jgi:hypothetical protein